MAHRHIGSTKRYHLIPIMMAIIKKMANDKCWWGCREIRSCLHWGEESKMTQLLWQVLRTFLKKLNTELRSSNSTTRYTLKRTENRFRHLFTAAWFTTAKGEINPRSANRFREKRRRSIHTIEYHAISKRNGVPTCAKMWINLEMSHQEKAGGHKRTDSVRCTYMKYLGQANSKREKADLEVTSGQGQGEWGAIDEGLQSSCLGWWQRFRNRSWTSQFSTVNGVNAPELYI